MAERELVIIMTKFFVIFVVSFLLCSHHAKADSNLEEVCRDVGNRALASYKLKIYLDDKSMQAAKNTDSRSKVSEVMQLSDEADKVYYDRFEKDLQMYKNLGCDMNPLIGLMSCHLKVRSVTTDLCRIP